MPKRSKQPDGKAANFKQAAVAGIDEPTWTQHGQELEGELGELVPVEDVYGRTHRVPRAALVAPPDRSKKWEWVTVHWEGKEYRLRSRLLAPTVVNLEGPDAAEMVKALAVGTGNEDNLGGFTITDGDLKRLARHKYLLWKAERPKRVKGGRGRAAQKPAATGERNEKMKKDYIVARMHDRMKMPDATKYLAQKYELTVPQVCRAIKPRALEREMRRS